MVVAASIIVDGEIIAAAHEERFTRKKHDADFPIESVKYCLEESGLRLSDLDAIAFYDKPYLKFERLLETYHSFCPSRINFIFIGDSCLDQRKDLYEKDDLSDLLIASDRLLGNPVKARYTFIISRAS